MHPIRKKRMVFLIIILAVLCTAAGLVLYALQQNINLFYTPTQIAQGEAPHERNIRAGGMVVVNSVNRHSDSLDVSFEVTDFQNNLFIKYKGILPDLFREGQGVVVKGKLGADGILIATQVLAKHDEKYMPPEVNAALKSAKSTAINIH